VVEQKQVKDLMIPLEDYPHIPCWVTLRQAMAFFREAAIKLGGSFEPKAVLVFDERYQPMGMLTLRDIVKGLEPRVMEVAGLAEADPDLTALSGDLFGPGMREASQKTVGEVMSPIKVTVRGQDPIAKAILLMMQEHVGLLAVIQGSKVAGIIRGSDLFIEIMHLVLDD
jgi:CBS-domain-containing membrane protein